MEKESITTVEEYLSQSNTEEQKGLRELRQTILGVSHEITEKIAWGVPTFYYKGHYLVQIATVKAGLAFYSSPETKAVFAEQLKPYRQTSKNAVHFSLDNELPLAVIAAMVQQRMKEKGDMQGHE